MGVHIVRRVADLGSDLVLAPERFDPRRTNEASSEKCLADYAEVTTENVTSRSMESGRPVLVLDTTHAYEGFVVLRHEPAPPSEIGSAKRRLHPGDVIISRLRPYLRQVAYVDPALFELAPGGNDVVASTEFYVIRGRRGFDAACIVPYLLSKAVQGVLAAGQEGGHHPRFSRELLMSLPVPEAAVSEASKTAAQIRKLSSGILASLRGCRRLVEIASKSTSQASQ